MEQVVVRPIGYVVEGLPREGPRVSRYSLVSTIRILDEYVEGLRGLDEYSHIVVLWVMHEAGPPRMVVKPFRQDAPEVGIFATRFPPRPNPIGLSVVELVSVEPPIIRVRGLDAWSGSPVIDLKPYDFLDVVRRPRVPRWFEEKYREGAARGEYPDWLGPCP